MVNKAIILGNLTCEVEIRYTQSGSAVSTLSVATNRRWKDKDGNKQEDVEYHRVVTWGNTAEFCGNYLTKGSKVYVEGRLQTRKWQDQSGNDKYTTEIIANTVQNLSLRSESQGGFQEPPTPPETSDGTGEEVPF